jgi:hypothetical protein
MKGMQEMIYSLCRCGSSLHSAHTQQAALHNTFPLSLISCNLRKPAQGQKKIGEKKLHLWLSLYRFNKSINNNISLLA